jgi:hypothetical protein
MFNRNVGTTQRYKAKAIFLTTTAEDPKFLLELLQFWILSNVLPFILKHDVSKAGFCLRLQVERALLLLVSGD